ncbi:Arc1 [Kluyveromyces lactis]|nr:Arc1 [Kluyveromyces lactis]
MSCDLLNKFEALSISAPSLTQEQKALEAQWDSVSKSGNIQGSFDELNLHLRDHTFVLGTAQPTVSDVTLFEHVLPVAKELINSSKDVKGNYAKYRHILRWSQYLNDLLQLNDLTLNIDLDLPREIIEKKKKEDKKDEAEASKKGGEAAAKKDGKADKQPRGKPDEETLKKLREEAKAKKAAKKAANAQQAQAPAQESAKPSPGVIDFRVGFIQKAVKHPDADSLYVSTIDVGDEEGPRTVCSGLVKYFPLEAMQERYVVVVCNLKPVNMRGIKSTAMVLCGSNENNVEFVEPPAGSKAGDKVFFEGFGDEEPIKQLNPKKKIWEQLQPHFSTNEQLEVIFKDEDDKTQQIRKLTNKNGDAFKVASIANACVR